MIGYEAKDVPGSCPQPMYILANIHTILQEVEFHRTTTLMPTKLKLVLSGIYSNKALEKRSQVQTNTKAQKSLFEFDLPKLVPDKQLQESRYYAAKIPYNLQAISFLLYIQGRDRIFTGLSIPTCNPYTTALPWLCRLLPRQVPPRNSHRDAV